MMQEEEAVGIVFLLDRAKAGIVVANPASSARRTASSHRAIGCGGAGRGRAPEIIAAHAKQNNVTAVALGAALFLTASAASVQAEDRDCTVDLKSLCAGVAPGEGHVQACIQSHISELSVGCSSRLSKAAWIATECHADIQHFCPNAKVGDVSDCMRPHLGEVSDQCKGAVAFIAAPAGD